MLLVSLYYTEESANFQPSNDDQLFFSLMHKLVNPVRLTSGGLFVSATSFTGDKYDSNQHKYGARDSLNIKSHSVDTYSPSYQLQTTSNFRSKNIDNSRFSASSGTTDNNQARNQNYFSSFSSSPFNPHGDLKFLQRTFSDSQLQQLFRSAGCVNDEIKLVSKKKYYF